jgi:transposase InsO family protein
VKFVFTEQHASTWPVNVMCSMLGVSRSGYYDWRGRAPSARTTANLALLSDVRRLQAPSGTMWIAQDPCRPWGGHRCSRGRVERLMRRHRIRALARRRFWPCTADSRHYLPTSPKLLAQRFSASVLNRLCLADITYIATGEGWLYLATVLDLATRKIVGWAMRDHMRTELPLAAMMMAASGSDRPRSRLPLGSWIAIRCRRLCRLLGDDRRSALDEPHRRLLRSCPDGEFLPPPKVKLVHQCRWPTHAEARQALFRYIEGYYNRHRMHLAIGYLTPE